MRYTNTLIWQRLHLEWLLNNYLLLLFYMNDKYSTMNLKWVPAMFDMILSPKQSPKQSNNPHRPSKKIFFIFWTKIALSFLLCWPMYFGVMEFLSQGHRVWVLQYFSRYGRYIEVILAHEYILQAGGLTGTG